MSFAGSLVGALFTPLIATVGKALFGGKPKAPVAPRPITRDMAADQVRAGDAMRRRRGFGATIITGGAEASTGGGKTLLGQ